MRSLIVRDFRNKNFFLMDDAYLNGYAKLVSPSVTAVYMSLCRHADKLQKSFPSIQLLAEEHSLSVSTVQRAIRKLVSLNIISRERTKASNGKWINNTYILLDKSVWKRATGHPRPMVKPQVIHDQTTGHPRPIKDTHKKGTHITPFVFPPKKYSSLKDIKEDDLLEISEKYRVPLAFVKLQLEKMENWCEAKGKHYKNYKRALMNWVLKEAEEKINRQRKGGFVDATQI